MVADHPTAGTFINDGTVSKTGGTGTSSIGNGITLNNTGNGTIRGRLRDD